jgi:hypothetical protein
MTDDQASRILFLAAELRKVGRGSMDWIYDLITDMESFVKGERSIVEMTADGWIEFAEHQLSMRGVKA